MSSGRVIAYLATSLDGFIAGADDDIGWLTEPPDPARPTAAGTWSERGADGLEFDEFMAGVGCLLMGRRTYDVVDGLVAAGEEWPYGDAPIVVATSRELAAVRPTVTAAAGSVEELVARAREVADGRDVYVDGGATVRAVLAAGLLDELIVSQVPTVVGAGVPLMDATVAGARLTVVDVRKHSEGLVQVRYRCR